MTQARAMPPGVRMRLSNKPDAIRLAGGAARSRPWRQAFALMESGAALRVLPAP